MSKNFIFLSCSALLLISSIVLSHTTKNNTSGTNNFSDEQHTQPHRFDAAIQQTEVDETLLLTKINTKTSDNQQPQTHDFNHRPQPIQESHTTTIDTSHRWYCQKCDL